MNKLLKTLLYGFLIAFVWIVISIAAEVITFLFGKFVLFVIICLLLGFLLSSD